MRTGKTHLSKLVNEEFIIARDERPAARVMPRPWTGSRAFKLLTADRAVLAYGSPALPA